MEFGELTDVDLREAWPNGEANDFTPWLANNLERLSAVIGLPLELEATEVSVEGFSADILARIPDDDSRVLIENQLEVTDHTHLGQIMTYLAGLEAKTVIWVARNFRAAHLSTIRWLNEHTTDDFAFFAVKVRVVRIGDASSPVAPLFEAVERPSEWDRRGKGAVETRMDTRSAEFRSLRRDFWHFHAERYPDDDIPPNHSNHAVNREIAGVIVRQSFSRDGVNVYVSRAEPGYDDQAKDLAERYTAAVTRDLGSRNRSFFIDALNPDNIDALNPDNWPEMADWLHERLGTFRRILEEEQGLFILVSPGHSVLFCHSEQSEESKVLARIAFLRYADEVPDEGFQILRFAQNDIC